MDIRIYGITCFAGAMESPELKGSSDCRCDYQEKELAAWVRISGTKGSPISGDYSKKEI